MRALLIAALAAAAATGHAANLDVDDLRVELGVSPGPSDTEEDFSPGSGSVRPAGSADYESGSSPCIDVWFGYASARLRDHGLSWAIGVDAARGKHSPKGLSARSLDYYTVGPQARLGYAWALSSSFHLEVTPFLGYGLAIVEWADAGAKDTGFGTAFTYGILAGGWTDLGRGWRLGGVGGFQGGWTQATVDVDATGGQSDLSMTSAGLVARIGMGYTF